VDVRKTRNDYNAMTFRPHIIIALRECRRAFPLRWFHKFYTEVFIDEAKDQAKRNTSCKS